MVYESDDPIVIINDTPLSPSPSPLVRNVTSVVHHRSPISKTAVEGSERGPRSHLPPHLIIGPARSPLILSLMRHGNLFHQNQQYFWINIFISTQVIIWKFLSLASSIIAVMMLWNNQENECWIYIRIIYHIYQQGCKDYITETFHMLLISW